MALYTALQANVRNQALKPRACWVFRLPTMPKGVPLHLRLPVLATGNALWLDSGQRVCLILWHTAEQWADIILSWARSVGMEESVTTLDELSSGDEVQGTGEDLP